MYVQQSSACDMPNSETPITAAQIAAQDQFVANVGQKFVDGNAALSDLISNMGGNPSTAAVGNAGVPGGLVAPSVPGSLPYVPAGARVITSPGWPGAWPVGGLFAGKNYTWPSAGGNVSETPGLPAGRVRNPGDRVWSIPERGSWPRSISAGFPGLLPAEYPCGAAGAGGAGASKIPPNLWGLLLVLVGGTVLLSEATK
jgi:hypothetical protein